MVAFGILATVVVLVVSASAAGVCLLSYILFKRKAALWLFLSISGLIIVGLAILVGKHLLSLTRDPMVFQQFSESYFVLLAMGNSLLVVAYPRFLLLVFGMPPLRKTRLLLAMGTIVFVILSVFRIATGWNDDPRILVPLDYGIRSVMFVFFCAALAVPIVFRKQLSDPNLYRAVVVQIGTLPILFPFSILEDMHIIAIEGFPKLAGLIFMTALSATTVFYVLASLMKPKYMEGNQLSRYFIDRFKVSRREIDIVLAMLDGLSNSLIADKLFVSPRTVENHLYRLYKKIGITSRIQLFNLLRSDAG